MTTWTMLCTPTAMLKTLDCSLFVTGDLQGDVIAPMKFAAAFTPAIDMTVRETKNWADELTLYQHEPITNQVLDTSYCLYADDVGRIGT
eukprot:13278347-Heterocapsa_arctica.AAC.1